MLIALQAQNRSKPFNKFGYGNENLSRNCRVEKNAVVSQLRICISRGNA